MKRTASGSPVQRSNIASIISSVLRPSGLAPSTVPGAAVFKKPSSTFDNDVSFVATVD